jgi:glucose-1-phosphate cytidylyltransferase
VHLVEIGGRPMLWHIMMHYSHYGFKDFAVALGYKGECIKKYMVDFCSLNSNLTVDFSSGSVTSHGHHDYDWKMDLIETGLKTQTGGRIKRLALYLGDTSF